MLIKTIPVGQLEENCYVVTNASVRSGIQPDKMYLISINQGISKPEGAL